MPSNFLVTGAPGCGKSTMIQRTVEILERAGFKAGGIYCPEIRVAGKRVGFKIIDIGSGKEGILAHIDQPVGPMVSRYKVNLHDLENIGVPAIERAIREADFVVIDEIAPMEGFSEKFVRAVGAVLDSQKPLLAAIHQKTTSGFIGETKARRDVLIFEVKRDTVETLPSRLATMIREAIGTVPSKRAGSHIFI